MKINILTDNQAGIGFEAEHGLSYLIEIDGESILFDTGLSDIFLRNASKLEKDIQNDVKKVVLSHGHGDHGNGLFHLNNKILLTHPGAFIKRYRKKDHSPIGLAIDEEKLQQKFKITTSSKPVQITQNLWFLGEIPRKTDFESKRTDFFLSNGKEDFIMDDSALVATINNEIVVISGCAHSGICNICEHAKKVSGVSKIKAVIGGFHLKDAGEQTKKTSEYFSDNKIKLLFPAHCTQAPAKDYFRQHFQFPDVKTGMILEF